MEARADNQSRPNPYRSQLLNAVDSSERRKASKGFRYRSRTGVPIAKSHAYYTAQKCQPVALGDWGAVASFVPSGMTWRNWTREYCLSAVFLSVGVVWLTMFHQSHNSELNCWDLSSSRSANMTRSTFPRYVHEPSASPGIWKQRTMLSPFEAMQSIGILIISIILNTM
jgi:hypothetical protein